MCPVGIWALVPSERGFQDSPSKAHSDAKRAHKDGGDEGLYLEDCVFEEDSMLDLALIPRVTGKVRLLRDGSDCLLTVVPGLRPVLSEEEEGIVRANLVSPQQEDSVRALQALYGDTGSKGWCTGQVHCEYTARKWIKYLPYTSLEH